MVHLNKIRYKIFKTISFSFVVFLSNCIVLYAGENAEIDRFDALSFSYRGNFQKLNYSDRQELIIHCNDKIEQYKSIIPLIGKKRQYAQFLKSIKPFADQATLMRENVQTFNSSAAAILSLPEYYEGVLKFWMRRKEFVLSGEGLIPKNLLRFTIEQDGEILREKEDVFTQRKILITISGFAKELSELQAKEWVHEKQISQVGQFISRYAEYCHFVEDKLKLKTEWESDKLNKDLTELIEQQRKIKVLINTWEGTAHICQQLRVFLDENKEIIARLGESLRFQMLEYRPSVAFLKSLSPTINILFYNENIDESYVGILSIDFIQKIIGKLDVDVHLAFNYRNTLRNCLKEYKSIAKKAKKILVKVESHKGKIGVNKIPNFKVKVKSHSESSDKDKSRKNPQLVLPYFPDLGMKMDRSMRIDRASSPRQYDMKEIINPLATLRHTRSEKKMKVYEKDGAD